MSAIVCTPELANSVACFERATTLSDDDLISGMQAMGPNRIPQSAGIPLPLLASYIGSGPGGPFLPLTGGTVTGATTFSAAGTGLTVGGAATLGNSNANYWTVSGGSGSPAIQAAGSGNLFASLNGLGTFGALLRSGNGTNLRTQDSGVAVGNFLNVTAGAAGSPLVLAASDNTGGISFHSPIQGAYNFTYNGVSSANANKPINFVQNIRGAAVNTSAFPISQIRNIYGNGFTTGQGAFGLRVTGEVDAGAIMRSNVPLRAEANQTAQPGTVSAWAATTAYSLGGFVNNGGQLYQATTAGTSASSGGPTGTGSSIADGTVVWQYCDIAAAAQTQVALGVLATTNFNVGGVSGAPVGQNFGSVIGGGLQNGSTFYNQNVTLELDNFINTGASVSRNATVQLVRSGSVQALYQDWGVSFYAAGSAKWINGILFQAAIDPNGYGISWQDQESGGLQTMAAAIDMRMVTPTGSGLSGGGFFLGWSNGSVDSTGTLNLGYTSLSPSATGLTVDIASQKCTAATVVSGGTGWVTGMWATDANGNYVTVTAAAGVVTAITVIVPAYSSSPPGGAQTFTAMTPTTAVFGATGSATRPTTFTATLTWAAATTPTLSLMPSGGTVQLGSGAFTANGSTAVSLTSIAPTGAHATVQEWLTITDSGGTVRYIPCF